MSTTRLALLALLLPGALLSARAARADLLVEGYKGVQHELRVEGLGDHPELVFLLSPVAFGRGVAFVSSDQPFPYMKAAEGRLYALRREEALTDDDLRRIDLAWLKAHAVAVSWHEFSQLGQIPEERPEARIVTVFRVARLDGRKLVIEGVREELFDDAVRCNVGKEPCTTVKKYNLVEVPVTEADQKLVRDAMVEVSLPAWSEQCDKNYPDCTKVWRSTIGPVVGVK